MSELTYRVFQLSDKTYFKQIYKLGTQLITDPQEVPLYANVNELAEQLASKTDCVVVGAFKADHTTLVGALCMYDLFANIVCENHCVEAFGFDKSKETQDIAFLTLMAVHFAYQHSNVCSELLSHAYRWAQRHNIGHIVGTFPLNSTGIYQLLASYDPIYSTPFIHTTTKTSMSCMHFCIKI